MVLNLVDSARVDTYTYEITIDGKVNPIYIEFRNGQFDRVIFPFSGAYTRDEWKVLSKIEAEITRLEQVYFNNGW